MWIFFRLGSEIFWKIVSGKAGGDEVEVWFWLLGIPRIGFKDAI